MNSILYINDLFSIKIGFFKKGLYFFETSTNQNMVTAKINLKSLL